MEEITNRFQLINEYLRIPVYLSQTGNLQAAKDSLVLVALLLDAVCRRYIERWSTDEELDQYFSYLDKLHRSVHLDEKIEHARYVIMMALFIMDKVVEKWAAELESEQVDIPLEKEIEIEDDSD